MKVVIAPDSFKECLSAQQVGKALAHGWRTVLPNTNIVITPMADGGEGTLSALVDATGGQYHSIKVTGSLGTPIMARFGVLGHGKTAVVEMAEASGLESVPVTQRNPMLTTTYGTGELIKAALDLGVEEVIVCLGGSATNDGGVGMMAALGVHFLDDYGKNIGYIINDFDRLAAMDTSKMDSRLVATRFITACDVNNPLTGANGASAVFGPQKGATPDMVAHLDMRLSRYADVLETHLDKRFRDLPGTGAAGGMSVALVAFMDASLKPGIEIVVQASGLDQHLENADLVITGEGRIDSQSLGGKTPVGVARHAKARNIPVIGVGGSVGRELDQMREAGLDAVFSVITGPCTLAEALADGETNLVQAGETIASIFAMSMKASKGKSVEA